MFVKERDNSFVNLPASIDNVLLYVAHEFSLGRSFATTVSKISAISYFHKLANVNDPTNAGVVKSALKGFKNASPPQREKIPLSIDDVAEIFKTIDLLHLPVYHVHLLKSMLTFTFFALLRPGEFTFSDNMLELQDIRIHEDFINISFARFKHAKSTPTEINVVKYGGQLCPGFPRPPGIREK